VAPSNRADRGGGIRGPLYRIEREQRLIAVGIFGTSALVLGQMAVQLINYRFYDLRLNALDSNADGGLFGVVGAVSLFAASAAAWTALPRLPRVRRL
jgi:hypothetical protein